MTDWLAVWLTDWLAGWLTDWMNCWLTNWLSNWLTGWLAQAVDEKMAIHLVLMKWPVSWTKDITTQSTEKPNSNASTYLATAFDIIPMLDSRGGIDEWPADVWTLSCAVMEPFSATPILRIKDIKNKVSYMQDATSITRASWWFQAEKKKEKRIFNHIDPTETEVYMRGKRHSYKFLKEATCAFYFLYSQSKGNFHSWDSILDNNCPFIN